MGMWHMIHRAIKTSTDPRQTIKNVIGQGKKIKKVN